VIKSNCVEMTGSVEDHMHSIHFSCKSCSNLLEGDNEFGEYKFDRRGERWAKGPSKNIFKLTQVLAVSSESFQRTLGPGRHLLRGEEDLLV